MADFASILNKKASEVEKPKPKPLGTYLAVIQGGVSQREVGDDKMEVLRHKVKLLSPQSDVNADQLAEHPPVSDWGSFNYDWFVNTEQGVFAYTQFLENTLGIEPEDKSLGQMAAETPGRQLLVKLRHRPFINKQNEAETSTEIESSAHV